MDEKNQFPETPQLHTCYGGKQWSLAGKNHQQNTVVKNAHHRSAAQRQGPIHCLVAAGKGMQRRFFCVLNEGRIAQGAKTVEMDDERKWCRCKNRRFDD